MVSAWGRLVLSARLLSEESRDSSMLVYALGLLPADKNKDELYQQLLILYFLNRSAEADQLLAKVPVNPELIQELTSSLAIRATETTNAGLLEKVISMTNQYQVPDRQKLIARYQINYDIHTKQWKEMSAAVDQLLALKGTEVTGREITEYTYYINQYSEDLIVIKRAIHWIKPLATVDGELQSVYLNAYATLLYKSGQYKEARQWTEKLLSLTVNNAGEEAGAKELMLKINAKSGSDD